MNEIKSDIVMIIGMLVIVGAFVWAIFPLLNVFVIVMSFMTNLILFSIIVLHWETFIKHSKNKKC